VSQGLSSIQLEEGRGFVLARAGAHRSCIGTMERGFAARRARDVVVAVGGDRPWRLIEISETARRPLQVEGEAVVGNFVAAGRRSWPSQ